MTETQHKIFMAACKSENLNPIPEYVFARMLGRKFRTDYYFELNGLECALEVDGGIWVNGRHNRGSGFIAGLEKRNAYTLLNIQQLTFTVQDIEQKPMSVIRAVKLCLGIGVEPEFIYNQLYPAKLRKEKALKTSKKRKAVAVKQRLSI